MEQHIKWLSIEQAKLGHDVHIWFNQGEKTTPSDRMILGFFPLHKVRPQFPAYFLFYLACSIKLIFTFSKVDSVHIHGDWSSFIFGRVIKKLSGADKLFFSVHGSIDQYTGIKKTLLLKAVKRADTVFCTGYNAHKTLLNHCKSMVQPSGIKPLFFEAPSLERHKRFTLVSVANLVKAKNLETLVEIAAELPDADFILIGDGTERHTLERTIELKALNNLFLKGFLPTESTAIALKKAHAFLLTSTKEGTPTAVLEAMAAGLPIIASTAGGLDEWLYSQQKEMLVDDPFDKTAYIEKIRNLMQNDQLINDLSNQNAQFARQFAWEKVALNITSQMLNAKT